MPAVVAGVCKWGHLAPLMREREGTVGKLVNADLCSTCLTSPDPETRANAGRLMHPDRYAEWRAKAALGKSL